MRALGVMGIGISMLCRTQEIRGRMVRTEMMVCPLRTSVIALCSTIMNLSEVEFTTRMNIGASCLCCNDMARVRG